MPPVLYTIETYDTIVWFRVLKARLTESRDIDEIGTALVKKAQITPKISLVLELDQVSHMSSAMLGKLLALHKAVKAGRGRMCVCGMNDNLMQIFRVTKLHKVFAIKKDAQEMLMYYKRKPL